MSYNQAVQALSRQWFPRLEIFFDPVPVVFTGDDIISFELLSESQGHSLVIADEIVVTLSNIEHRFTPTNTISPYFGKLRPGVKVRLFLALAIPGLPNEEVPLGEYTINDWDAPGDAITARFTAYDRMFALINQPMPEFPIQAHTTVQAMIATLFSKIGLASAEYRFENVPNVPIEIGSYERESVGQALNLLADAVGCIVHVDAQNVINVMSMFHPKAGLPIPLWTSDMFISAKNPYRHHEVFSRVEYTYCLPSLGEEEILLEKEDVILQPGLTRIGQEFATPPIGLVESIQLLKARSSAIQHIEYGTHKVLLIINNSGLAAETVTVRIIGRSVVYHEVVETVTDSAAEALYGIKTVAVKNIYIQSQTLAMQAAQRKLSHVKDPTALFHLETRGDPKLNVFNFLEIEVPEHGVPRTLVQPVKITLDFTGGLMSTIDARRAVT